MGTTLTLDVVSPVKPQLCIQDAYMLPQLQKLLGEINWMRPWIPITTADLISLFDLLKGLDLASTVTLNPIHRDTLTKVQHTIDNAALKRYDPNLPLVLYIMAGETLLTALLAQEGIPYIGYIYLWEGHPECTL